MIVMSDYVNKQYVKAFCAARRESHNLLDIKRQPGERHKEVALCGKVNLSVLKSQSTVFLRNVFLND